MWLTFTPIGATPQAAEAATLATKGQNKGPQHVEGGQTSREQGNDIQGIIPMIKGQPNNGFFAIEARKEGETSNGKRGNQPGNTGNGHLWPQTTHQAYILYLAMHGMMQGMQDAASTEEEQSLEESVCEEVEHARARTILTGYPQTHKHVAQLANGREGQHTFEVILDKSDGGGEKGRDATNPGHDPESSRISGGKEWKGTRHHIDTCRNHGGRMDECAHGRGTFHSRWQPDMQRNLGRFTNGPTEDQDANHKAYVTNAVRDKCLDGGRSWRKSIFGRFGLLVDPETDQQIRTEADQFPTNEDDQ